MGYPIPVLPDARQIVLRLSHFDDATGQLKSKDVLREVTTAAVT